MQNIEVDKSVKYSYTMGMTGFEELREELHRRRNDPSFKTRLRRGWRTFRSRVNRFFGGDQWPLMTRKVRKERGRYGIARSDCWSLDSYLVRVMERGLRMLAEAKHGWPPITVDGREWTFDEWIAHLIEQADKLDRSQKIVNEAFDSPDYKLGDGSIERAEEESDRLRKEVLTELSVIWGHLWD